MPAEAHTAARRALRALLAAAVMASPFAGCKPPDYVKFFTERKDAEFEVPWGWKVYLDQQDKDYYSYTFIGPFDPLFYHGVPSLSVRWYAHDKYHSLPGNEVEIYKNPGEYIEKTLETVYGPERSMEQPLSDIKVSGWAARKFVVASPAYVQAASPYGVLRDKATGQTAVLRWHAYIVVPMNNGFYVLIYPATREGFKRYESRFVHLIKSFKVKTDGPDGEKL